MTPKVKIIFNDEISANDLQGIKTAIIDNDGYCPCRVVKNADTKCMCKEFREQASGVCHCGLYKKIIVE